MATTACGDMHYARWQRVLASSAAYWTSTWARYGRIDVRRLRANRLNIDQRQSCGIFPCADLVDGRAAIAEHAVDLVRARFGDDAVIRGLAFEGPEET